MLKRLDGYVPSEVAVTKPSVLIIDCPESLYYPLSAALRAAGLDIMVPEPTADKRSEGTPAVILLYLSALDDKGKQAVQQWHDEYKLWSPALIALVKEFHPALLKEAAEIGLQDCLAAAEAPELIAARTLLVQRARELFLQTSPLTGLPGVGALEREIQRRLSQRGEMALLAFDLDYFKSYNDCYGYQRGDELLRYVAGVLQQALEQEASSGYFLAHLGGDDFLALVHPREAARVAQQAIEAFEAGRNQFYNPEDVARGKIITRGRDGQLAAWPLVSLTIVVVTNASGEWQHSGQMAAALAELKAIGKSLPGSVYVSERGNIIYSACKAPG